MLSALKKQLQQERRATTLRGPVPLVPTVAATHEVTVEVEFTETPLPLLSPEDAAKLEAVRHSHPRLHASLSALDSVQLAAVLSTEPSLLVRAPVGSGKTTVLVHKVLYLHFVLGVPLRELAVLTFTNRAAAEIRARITALSEQVLSDDDFWLTGTFHGVARALLSRVLPIAQLGYRPDFTVLDEEQQEAIFDELIRTERLRVGRRSTLRQRMRQLSDAKSAPVKSAPVKSAPVKSAPSKSAPSKSASAKSALAKSAPSKSAPAKSAPSKSAGSDLERLAQLFVQEKQRRNALDFDDLIDHATTLLPELQAAAGGDGSADADPAHAAAGSLGAIAPPRWLIVDELQDCEPRELALLSRLRGAGTGFFAVGDPYQAIYGWRGSDPALFAQAEATFQCSAAVLPRNYRSTRTIVDSARAVLGFQPGRPSGTLSAARSFGELLIVRRHHDPVSEALYLAERITRLHESGIPYGELAILFRLRAQAEPLRAALCARNIPCSEPTEAAGDAVRLLTLHAAKGLEFRQVFLSGINEGLVPLGHRFDLCGDAEERRLLFVGLTRARDRVEISYHVRPHEFSASGEPSRYLAFIPRSLVTWENESSVAPTPALVAVHHTSPAPPAAACDSLEFTFVSGPAAQVSSAALVGESLAFSFLSVSPAPASAAARAGEPMASPSVLAEQHRAAALASEPMASPAVFAEQHRAAALANESLASPSAPVAPDLKTEAAEVKPAAPAGTWQPGQAVRHPRYGAGVVLRVDAGTVHCTFGKFGERAFPLTLCPLLPDVSR